MEKKKNDTTLKKVKRGLRRRTILFLLLAASANSFAWFVYTNKVQNSITANVKSWHITFEDNENELVENVKFDIDAIYPGMEMYVNSITIDNLGETAATVGFEIQRMNILGTEFTLDTHTSLEMLDILKNGYPFDIDLSVSNPHLAVGASEQFLINVTWPFESGNDELDTQYGKLASDFIEANPDSPCISMDIKLEVTQLNEP